MSVRLIIPVLLALATPISAAAFEQSVRASVRTSHSNVQSTSYSSPSTHSATKEPTSASALRAELCSGRLRTAIVRSRS